MADFSRYNTVAQINTGNTFLAFPASSNSALVPFDCQTVAPFGFVTPTAWLASTVTFIALPYLLTNNTQYVNGIPTNSQLAPVYDETDTGTLYQIVTQSGLGYYRLPPTLFNA